MRGCGMWCLGVIVPAVEPKLNPSGGVIGRCPDCAGAITTFNPTSGNLIYEARTYVGGQSYSRLVYALLACSGCGRGGLAKIRDNGRVAEGALEWFTPHSVYRASVPAGTPKGIVAEFREAETCASVGAFRAASALLRSALEKTLGENGYVTGSLAARIDEAASDGVITQARKQKAHEEIRVLGNEIVHEDWRPVDAGEYELSHHYVQRVIEDFYDDRQTTEKLSSADASKVAFRILTEPSSLKQYTL